MDQKMLKELAEMGVIVIEMDHPDKAIEVYNVLAKVLGEEHQLDYLNHKQNQEWTDG